MKRKVHNITKTLKIKSNSSFLTAKLPEEIFHAN